MITVNKNLTANIALAHSCSLSTACDTPLRSPIGSFCIVSIIPDIESVNFGRGVGYEINEYLPPKDVASISATGIRNCIKNKDDYWRKLVDPIIQDDVLNYLLNENAEQNISN